MFSPFANATLNRIAGNTANRSVVCDGLSHEIAQSCLHLMSTLKGVLAQGMSLSNSSLQDHDLHGTDLPGDRLQSKTLRSKLLGLFGSQSLLSSCKRHRCLRLCGDRLQRLYYLQLDWMRPTGTSVTGEAYQPTAMRLAAAGTALNITALQWIALIDFQGIQLAGYLITSAIAYHDLDI